MSAIEATLIQLQQERVSYLSRIDELSRNQGDPETINQYFRYIENINRASVELARRA